MITEAKLDFIPKRTRNTSVVRDVMQFHESDWNAAEVNIEKYSNVDSAFNVYKATIKRLRVAVAPISRKGKLYLVRSGPSGSECG